MGDRYNNGKPMMSLLPPIALEEVAKVLTYGAKKYDKHNWLKGLLWTEILDSAERHISDWKKGRNNDKESNLNQIAHAACNLLMLIEMIHLREDLDDRPTQYYNQQES